MGRTKKAHMFVLVSVDEELAAEYLNSPISSKKLREILHPLSDPTR